MTKKSFIYGLVDPRDKVIRYIGKSVDPKVRFRAHLSESKKGKISHKCNWIRLLITNGLKPELVILKANVVKWEYWEKFFIKKHKSTLVNLTDGGDGITSDYLKKLWKNDIYRKKQVSRMIGSKNPFYGKKHTDEVIKVLSKNAKGNTNRRGSKNKISSNTQNRLNQKGKKAVALLKKGVVVNKFLSIRQLCSEMNFDRRTAQRVLNKEKHYKTIKGYELKWV